MYSGCPQWSVCSEASHGSGINAGFIVFARAVSVRNHIDSRPRILQKAPPDYFKV